MRKLWIFIIIFCFLLLINMQANATNFSDEFFNNSDWTSEIIIQDGPTADFNAYQVSSGGYPDQYRYLYHEYGGNGNIITGHLYNSESYNPSTQGAISHIDASFDLMLISVGVSGAVGYGILIYQNETYYWGINYHTPYQGNEYNWQTTIIHDLIASNFYKSEGSGPEYPDFSSTGAEIQFGYFGANGTSLSDQTTSESGIDNWSVTINPIPEPTTLLLLGAGLIGLAGLGRKKFFRKG